MARKSKKEIGKKIVAWILLIAMVVSVFATGLFVLFG